MDDGTNRTVNLTRLLAIVTTVDLAVAMIAFGLLREDYSHVRNTFSELGEFGGVHSAAVSWGVFLPVGLAALVLAILQLRQADGARQFAAAGLCAAIAAGYIVAAFYPCDPGSPLSGSARQSAHNLGGAIEYIGGAVALAALAWRAPRYRRAFFVAAILVTATAIGVSVPEWFDVRGLIQRIGETALFGGLILVTLRK